MTAGDANPPFVQTFGTTVHPIRPELPELSIVWMPRSDLPIDDKSLQSLSARLDDPDEAPTLEIRDFLPDGRSAVVNILAWHLRAGRTMPPKDADRAKYTMDYIQTAQSILAAEVPLRTSPLHSMSLGSLVGGSGVVGVLEIFHSGVSPAEAAVSVLFVAGAIIVLGTANAVRRALEAGVETKLLAVFGVERDKHVSDERETIARRAKAAQRKKESRGRTIAAISTKDAGTGNAVLDAAMAASRKMRGL
jgi:hypothetical protein